MVKLCSYLTSDASHFHSHKKTLGLLSLGLLFLQACSQDEAKPQPKVSPAVVTATPSSSLAQHFLNPPDSSKPLTWFHAMSGNMSAAGITKDLEAIADAGIGGTLLFNVTQGIPLGKVKFNSTEHIDLIGHMAKESQRLGLTFGMHNCDGWTSSGGPWVTPEHSMKRLTFNQLVIDGGQVDVNLPQPASLLDYYQEVAVIAYPALVTDIQDAQNKPVFTASDATFAPELITNNDLTDYSTLAVEEGETGWLQFSYAMPYTLRLVDMLLHNGRGLEVSLHISDDGEHFTEVHDLALIRPGKTTFGFDQAFSGFTAKHFRLVTNKPMNIKELRLSSTPTMDNYTGRTSASRTDFQAFSDIGAAPSDLTIQASSVIELSDKMDANGRLQAQLPPGKWTVMRFGYTSTGAINIPASREGTGLEVDKFSRAAFKLHYDNYMTNVINKVKDVAPNALHTLEIDSYEVGAQNWTHDYQQHFETAFGYDLVPFLPLFAGKFVDSAETSEAVLWDTRELNNQLIAANYYGYFTELANQDGIQTYLEPYGSGPFNELDVARKADLPMGEFWLDNNNFRLAAARSAANIYNKPIIAAEAFTQFPRNNWLFHPSEGKHDGDKSWALGVNQHVFHRFAHQANTHVMPGMTMNRWGAHFDRTQPWWTSAGKAWFAYIARGQHLLREGHQVSDILWYLGDATPTTCPEKDLLSAVVPISLNYDCLNSEVLQRLSVNEGKLQLPHGSQYKVLVLNNHQKLSFQSLKKVYELAKQGAVIIGEPVRALSGRNISAAQQAEFETMVAFIWSQPTTHNIVIDAKTNHGHTGLAPEHNIAKSTIIDWDSIYAQHNFSRDLQIKGIEQFYYTHRQDSQRDIYFVFNDSDQVRLLDAKFNVTGKIPELWDAQHATITQLGAFEHTDTHTRVAFTLAPKQSMFVVFAESSAGITPLSPDWLIEQHALSQANVVVELNSQKQKRVRVEQLTSELQQLAINQVSPRDAITLDGQWQVSFEEKYGLAQIYAFEQLIDWRAHPDPQVRNYSGTARYEQRFTVPSGYLQDNTRVVLDLGQVSVAAKVSINGKPVATAWVAPYELEVSEWLVEGENSLEIDVANLWVNRLLADHKLPDTSGFKIARWQDPITPMPSWYTDNLPPPASERITFTTQKFMQDDEPTQPSGLLGPVRLKPEYVLTVK